MLFPEYDAYCIIVPVRELAAKMCRASKTVTTTQLLRIILIAIHVSGHSRAVLQGGASWGRDADEGGDHFVFSSTEKRW